MTIQCKAVYFGPESGKNDRRQSEGCTSALRGLSENQFICRKCPWRTRARLLVSCLVSSLNNCLGCGCRLFGVRELAPALARGSLLPQNHEGPAGASSGRVKAAASRRTPKSPWNLAANPWLEFWKRGDE